MRYRIASVSGDRVVLRFSMPERPFIISILIVMGVFFLFLGIADALPDAGPPEPLLALFFIGFGLFCFCAIFLFATGLHFPARLIFDNAEGWLLVKGKKGETEGAVPYSGIAGISVCRTASDRMILHSTGIDLRQGSRWELYAARKEAKALAFKETLGKSVKLDATPGKEPRVSSGPHREGEAAGRILFSWRRKSNALQLGVSVLSLISFCGAIVGMKPFASGPTAYLVALAFVAFLLVMAVWGIIRTAGESNQVEIDTTAVTWRRRSLFLGERTASMPRADIAAVDLSFSFARMESAITLLRQEETEPFTRYRRGTFEGLEAFRIISFIRKLNRIDMSALPLGDRLSLTEAIRESLG
jgi:hypothetical protein